jgi:hypothetical protein
MTSSTTADKAASNGTDTTTDAIPTQREHGIIRVHEEQVYHVTGLAESALYEAERLMYALKTSAMKRIGDHDGTKGIEPLEMDHVTEVIVEALDCIDVAAEQLSKLSIDIRTRQDCQSLIKSPEWF